MHPNWGDAAGLCFLPGLLAAQGKVIAARPVLGARTWRGGRREVEDHRFRMDKNGEHDESLTITPGWQGARSAKLRSGSLRAAHEKL
jgi:hypothetical protein